MSRTNKRNKQQPKKARDWGVVMMLAHTKPGNHGHPKRQESKTKCRGKVDVRKDGW